MNYDLSPTNNGNPLSQSYTELKLLDAVQFSTGAINTAVAWDIYDFQKRLLYIDITGVNTGGMSAPVTFSVSAKPVNGAGWAVLHSYSCTNTAYVYSLNPSGVALSGLWMPLANIKAVITNPNTGTSTNTQCTATIKLTLALQK